MLIGELIKRAGVTKDTVRLYERKGFITSTAVQAGSREYRDYPEETVETIQNIRQARLYGVSLHTWKTFHDQWTRSDLTDAQRATLLDDELKKLRVRLRQLHDFEAVLVDKIARYSKK